MDNLSCNTITLSDNAVPMGGGIGSALGAQQQNYPMPLFTGGNDPFPGRDKSGRYPGQQQNFGGYTPPLVNWGSPQAGIGGDPIGIGALPTKLSNDITPEQFKQLMHSENFGPAGGGPQTVSFVPPPWYTGQPQKMY